MEYVRLGKTGLLVSELCLGTMTFGNEADEAMSVQIMNRALDAGFNFFDTSHNYNLGATEEIVGRWLGPHRQEIILASKVFFPSGGGRNDEGLSRRNLIFSVEKSLQRLQTDYLDMLYLHHWDENVDLRQTLGAVKTLVEQGKVIYCAVSNFSAWQTMKAIALAEALEAPPIVLMQPMYNLLKRQAEVELLPLAEAEGIAVCPYSPIAAGMLTGKYLRGERGRITDTEMYRQRYANPVYTEVTERFVAYAEAHQQDPAALAAAWVQAHPAVTASIIGARNLEQFDGITGCLELRLSEEERAAITALSIDPPHATDREPMDVFRKRGW